MTECKRTWWMLHWPSMLALAVGLGAFTTVNVPQAYPILWNSGWPLEYAYRPGLDQYLANAVISLTVLCLAVVKIESICIRLQVGMTLKSLLAVTASVSILVIELGRLLDLRDWQFEHETFLVARLICLVFAMVASFGFLHVMSLLFDRLGKTERSSAADLKTRD